jgi:hypothetical protein
MEKKDINFCFPFYYFEQGPEGKTGYVFPCICFKPKERLIHRCCAGCVYCELKDPSRYDAIEWLFCFPCITCDNFTTCVSPCFCACHVTKREHIKGNSANEDINNYILEHGLRTQDYNYIYHTCGKCLISKGPIKQTMLDGEVENILKEKLIENQLFNNSPQLSDSANLSKLISEY